MDKYDLIKKGFDWLELDITDNQINKFINYYNLLVEWNNKINLTAITEYNEVVIKHFLDSLLIIKFIDINGVNNIIDIGTGAGFPGIPLKIVYNNVNIALIDSLNKRVKFLNEVISKLRLTNISAFHERAENFAKSERYREKFDLCISRAVANLSTLSEYCLPFVKIGGYFVSYKSKDIKEEIKLANKAIKKLGGELKDLQSYNLYNTDIERTFVIVNKVSSTPKYLPRKAGKPSKEPIL